MLFFFLGHEAVEVLIFVMVFAPALCRKHPGRVLYAGWVGLATISIIVAFNDHHHHGADVISWGAFISDSLNTATGTAMVKKWVRSSGRDRVITAEGMAGIGFIAHGKFLAPSWAD